MEIGFLQEIGGLQEDQLDQSGDHLQEDLAKFGYRSDRKVSTYLD
jgi:hypothetical protein